MTIFSQTGVGIKTNARYVARRRALANPGSSLRLDITIVVVLSPQARIVTRPVVVLLESDFGNYFVNFVVNCISAGERQIRYQSAAMIVPSRATIACHFSETRTAA
jgi:hypothetical protein